MTSKKLTEVLIGWGYKEQPALGPGLLHFTIMSEKIRLIIDFAANHYNETVAWFRYKDDSESIKVTVSAPNKVRELALLLEALSKPELLPLCIDIEWAREFVSHVFQEVVQ